ncbi:AHH domain-containing protein [Myxococcus hansupus]|uniref:AHH domain-containing protein n=1 Tax=Pseudomyxococcus hansupus TaxID=1297742 RepID=UPI0009E4BAB5
MGVGGRIQGDPDGEIHHIYTDKNDMSDRTGGPWTPVFRDCFMQAGLSLDDAANLVRIRNHNGSQAREHH